MTTRVQKCVDTRSDRGLHFILEVGDCDVLNGVGRPQHVPSFEREDEAPARAHVIARDHVWRRDRGARDHARSRENQPGTRDRSSAGACHAMFLGRGGKRVRVWVKVRVGGWVKVRLGVRVRARARARLTISSRRT